ncbi:MAG TPA: hypothetical protein VFZ46_05490 [Nitrososphaeraceae archaeon]
MVEPKFSTVSPSPSVALSIVVSTTICIIVHVKVSGVGSNIGGCCQFTTIKAATVKV